MAETLNAALLCRHQTCILLHKSTTFLSEICEHAHRQVFFTFSLPQQLTLGWHYQAADTSCLRCVSGGGKWRSSFSRPSIGYASTSYLMETVLFENPRPPFPPFPPLAKKKSPFILDIVSKCAHLPAVCYSAVGLTGHVSQPYNRAPPPRTMVWMVGVKGQPPPDSGSSWYHCWKRVLILCCLLCTQCFCPGALAFLWPLLEPQWAIRWAIESSQTPSAVIIH